MKSQEDVFEMAIKQFEDNHKYIQGFNYAEQLIIQMCQKGSSFLAVIPYVNNTVYRANKNSMELLQQGKQKTALNLLLRAEKLLGSFKCKELAFLINLTYNNLACVYKRRGKPLAALKCLEKGTALCLEFNEKDNIAITHLNICAILSQLGNHKAASEEAFKASIQCTEDLEKLRNIIRQSKDPVLKVKKEYHEKMSLLGISYYNLGVQEEFIGNYKHALEWYQKACSIVEGNPEIDLKLKSNFYTALKQATDKVKSGVAKKVKMANSVITKKDNSYAGNQMNKSETNFIKEGRTRPISAKPRLFVNSTFSQSQPNQTVRMKNIVMAKPSSRPVSATTRGKKRPTKIIKRNEEKMRILTPSISHSVTNSVNYGIKLNNLTQRSMAQTIIPTDSIQIREYSKTPMIPYSFQSDIFTSISKHQKSHDNDPDSDRKNTTDCLLKEADRILEAECTKKLDNLKQEFEKQSKLDSNENNKILEENNESETEKMRSQENFYLSDSSDEHKLLRMLGFLEWSDIEDSEDNGINNDNKEKSGPNLVGLIQEQKYETDNNISQNKGELLKNVEEKFETVQRENIIEEENNEKKEEKSIEEPIINENNDNNDNNENIENIENKPIQDMEKINEEINKKSEEVDAIGVLINRDSPNKIKFEQDSDQDTPAHNILESPKNITENNEQNTSKVLALPPPVVRQKSENLLEIKGKNTPNATPKNKISIINEPKIKPEKAAIIIQKHYRSYNERLMYKTRMMKNKKNQNMLIYRGYYSPTDYLENPSLLIIQYAKNDSKVRIILYDLKARTITYSIENKTPYIDPDLAVIKLRKVWEKTLLDKTGSISKDSLLFYENLQKFVENEEQDIEIEFYKEIYEENKASEDNKEKLAKIEEHKENIKKLQTFGEIKNDEHYVVEDSRDKSESQKTREKQAENTSEPKINENIELNNLVIEENKSPDKIISPEKSLDKIITPDKSLDKILTHEKSFEKIITPEKILENNKSEDALDNLNNTIPKETKLIDEKPQEKIAAINIKEIEKLDNPQKVMESERITPAFKDENKIPMPDMIKLEEKTPSFKEEKVEKHIETQEKDSKIIEKIPENSIEKQPENSIEKIPVKIPENSIEKQPENNIEKQPENNIEKQPEKILENILEKVPENPDKKEEKIGEINGSNTQRNSMKDEVKEYEKPRRVKSKRLKQQIVKAERSKTLDIKNHEKTDNFKEENNEIIKKNNENTAKIDENNKNNTLKIEENNQKQEENKLVNKENANEKLGNSPGSMHESKIESPYIKSYKTVPQEIIPLNQSISIHSEHKNQQEHVSDNISKIQGNHNQIDENMPSFDEGKIIEKEEGLPKVIQSPTNSSINLTIKTKENLEIKQNISAQKNIPPLDFSKIDPKNPETKENLESEVLSSHENMPIAETVRPENLLFEYNLVDSSRMSNKKSGMNIQFVHDHNKNLVEVRGIPLENNNMQEVKYKGELEEELSYYLLTNKNTKNSKYIYNMLSNALIINEELSRIEFDPLTLIKIEKFIEYQVKNEYAIKIQAIIRRFIAQKRKIALSKHKLMYETIILFQQGIKLGGVYQIIRIRINNKDRNSLYINSNKSKNMMKLKLTNIIKESTWEQFKNDNNELKKVMRFNLAKIVAFDPKTKILGLPVRQAVPKEVKKENKMKK